MQQIVCQFLIVQKSREIAGLFFQSVSNLKTQAAFWNSSGNHQTSYHAEYFIINRFSKSKKQCKLAISEEVNEN
jgi:hypothetical protein